MKRIEMIDEIMCCLLSYSVNYPQYPLSQLRIAAEEILKMQEEAGMLPPTFSDYKEGDEVHSILFGGDKPIKNPTNAWEPDK